MNGENEKKPAAGGPQPSSDAGEQVGMLTRVTDGREFNLGYGSLQVGRQKRADLVIDDKTVSRHHADVCYERGRYVLYDHSTNGTWVNNQLVAVAQPLRTNDRVKFGQVEFVFSLKNVPRQAGARSLEQTAARRVQDTATLVMKEGKAKGRGGSKRWIVAIAVIAVLAAVAVSYFLLF
jgi:pSer/pThr/pTyr-binding forkhead associated (FHA) protein